MLTFWIFTELSIWDKFLSYLKNRVVGGNYNWNYRLSKLLLHFIEYLIDQRNSKHTKTAVSLISKSIQFFESPGKSLKFFGPTTTKWWSCKIFVKWNKNHLLMANIFKLHKYQTFGLLKMHNSKIWFANSKFSLWESLVYDKRSVKNAVF